MFVVGGGGRAWKGWDVDGVIGLNAVTCFKDGCQCPASNYAMLFEEATACM